MELIEELDWNSVKSHYEQRFSCHLKLLKLFKSKNKKEFAELALGISDPHGNYSANTHGLGPKILTENGKDSYNRIFDFAEKLVELSNPADIPILVKKASIKYLGISVTSEISCLLNPNRFWVTNSRTMWAHCLVIYGDDVDAANEVWKAYKRGDDSEMNYVLWSDAHVKLEVSMRRLAKLGSDCSRNEKIPPGDLLYLC